ncbi:MAG TPA: hypothetical protein VIK62_02210 [Verrucomicrobiae bacterium]
MNWRRHFILGLVVAGGLSAASLRAGSAPENPYTPIITRNVFALVPIPIGPPVALTPEVPPPKITPNGIMTLFGKLQVLFKVAGVAHPGQPPKDESYVLGAGERQDEIEVQAIDEKAATITFNNHGVVQKLSLVASAASGGAAAPAATTFGSPGIPRPNLAPGAGGIGFGGRFGRNRTLPGASNPAPSDPNAGSAPVNSRIYNPGASSNPADEQLSPEQQVILIEAQRLKYQQEGNPIANLLPPTVMTPQPNGEGGDSAPAPEVPMPGN